MICPVSPAVQQEGVRPVYLTVNAQRGTGKEALPASVSLGEASVLEKQVDSGSMCQLSWLLGRGL